MTYIFFPSPSAPFPAGADGTAGEEKEQPDHTDVSAQRTKSPIDPYHYYRKNLLSPARVRELSRLRPRRVVVDTLACWAWILAAWAAVALWPHWWTVLLAIPVIGSRYYALFIIAHDGLHRRLFRRSWANDLFNDLFILGAIGGITRINNQNHLTHHHRLATPLDPDRHRHGCFNKASSFELLSFLIGAASVLKSARNVFLRGTPAPATVTSAPVARRARPGYRLRDLVILVAWQGLLFWGLTWAIGWWAYPVLWLVPVFIFTILADNFRSFAEHSHPEADHRADAHRLITYLSSPVERMFLAPMNMNYHAAHHLYPSIPYYNLPQADEEIRRLPGSRGLEWRASYLAYLWRYYRALPLEECRSGSR